MAVNHDELYAARTGTTNATWPVQRTGFTPILIAPGVPSGGMRTVEVSRFVPIQPEVVERALTPTNVVEYEGTFEPVGIEEQGDGSTLVTAVARGLQVELRFEPHPDGLRYMQEGDKGPFDEMETEWTFHPEDEGVRVVARSTASLGLPLAAITDRVAAWKRRHELDRAIDALLEDVA